MSDTATPMPDDAQAILDRQSEATKRMLAAAWEKANHDAEQGMKVVRWVLDNTKEA